MCQDGISQSNELFALASLNIKAINLVATSTADLNSSDFVESPRHFLHTQIHEGAHLRRHKG